MLQAHHKNYFENVEKVRADFEAAKKATPEEFDEFIKVTEEWLELTFFPAVSQWPTRLYTNKYNLNVAFPDSWHEYDPTGSYKPRPIFGNTPVTGPFYRDYPLIPNFYAFDAEAEHLRDPYLEEHLDKIEDPEMKDKIDY